MSSKFSARYLPHVKQEAEVCVAQFVTVVPNQEIRYFRMRRGQLFPEDDYYLEQSAGNTNTDDQPPVYTFDFRTCCYSLDGLDRPIEREVKDEFDPLLNVFETAWPEETYIEPLVEKGSVSSRKPEERAESSRDGRSTGVEYFGMEMPVRQNWDRLSSSCSAVDDTNYPENKENWTIQNALRRVQQRNSTSMHSARSACRRSSSDSGPTPRSLGHPTPRSSRSLRGNQTPGSSRSLGGSSHSTLAGSPRLSRRSYRSYQVSPHNGDGLLHLPDQPSDQLSPRSAFSDSCLSVQYMGGITCALVRSDSENSIVSMSTVMRQLHGNSQRDAENDHGKKSYTNAFERQPNMEKNTKASISEPLKPAVKAASPKKSRRSIPTRAMSDRDSMSRFSSNDSIGHSSFNGSRDSAGSSKLKVPMPPSVGNVLTWNRPRPGALLEVPCSPTNRKSSPKPKTSPFRGQQKDFSSRVSISSIHSSVSRGTYGSPRSTYSFVSSLGEFTTPESKKKTRGHIPSPPPSTPTSSPSHTPSQRASPKLPIKRPGRSATLKPESKPKGIPNKVPLDQGVRATSPVPSKD